MTALKGELVRAPGGRWAKGSVPNPHGSLGAAWTPEMREAMRQARALAPEAVRKLAELMQCGTPQVELKAAELVLSRVFGAPKPVELAEETPAKAVDLGELPSAERLAMLEDAHETVTRALELERQRNGR